MKIDLTDKRNLREQVKFNIVERIRSGTFAKGSRIPSERNLSAEFKVSKKTVELALKELEWENVLLRRVGRGTFVTKEVKSQSIPKKETIAVFVSNIVNPLFAEFSSIIEEILFRKGKSTIICRADILRIEEDKYINMLLDKGIEGAIIWGGKPRTEEILAKNGVSIVNIKNNEMIKNRGIYIDLYKAGKLIAEHLISIGRKNIKLVGAFPYNDENSMDLRCRGILDVMHKNKLNTDEVIITQKGPISRNSDYVKIGRDLTKILLKSGPLPDAIIYYNDARAFGGMRVLLQNGIKIPEDIAVASFDNTTFCDVFCPSLTSTGIDLNVAAEKAVEMLFDPGKKGIVKLKIELNVRESTTLKK